MYRLGVSGTRELGYHDACIYFKHNLHWPVRLNVGKMGKKVMAKGLGKEKELVTQCSRRVRTGEKAMESTKGCYQMKECR